MQKVFMLGMNVFDALLVAYAEVWILTQWMPLINPDAVATRTVAASIISIGAGFTIYRYVDKMDIDRYILITVCSYLLLPIVYISFDWITMLAGMLGKALHHLNVAFDEKLIYSNIKVEESIKYRTLCRPLWGIGSTLGGILALYIPVPQGYTELAYMLIFISIDVDFYLKYMLIKMKWLRFE